MVAEPGGRAPPGAGLPESSAGVAAAAAAAAASPRTHRSCLCSPWPPLVTSLFFSPFTLSLSSLPWSCYDHQAGRNSLEKRTEGKSSSSLRRLSPPGTVFTTPSNFSSPRVPWVPQWHINTTTTGKGDRSVQDGPNGRSRGLRVRPRALSTPVPSLAADLSGRLIYEFVFSFFFFFFFSLLRAPRRSRLSLDASPRRGGQAVGQRSSSPLRRQVRQVGRGAKSEAWQLVHLGCTRFLWLVSNRSSPRARPAATGFGVLISFAGDYHTEQQTFVPPSRDDEETGFSFLYLFGSGTRVCHISQSSREISTMNTTPREASSGEPARSRVPPEKTP